MKALIFPNDPLIAYEKKGELKDRYFNPNNIFDEVYFITFCDTETTIDKIQNTIGTAKGKIFSFNPLGNKAVFKKEEIFQEISKVIDKLDIDVVRAYNPTLTGYFAVKSAQYKDVKSVVSIHNMFGKIRTYIKYKKDFFRAIKYWILYPTEQWVYKNSDKIIGVTKACFDSISKSELKKTETIFNKVYLDKFYPKDIKKEYDIIMVGRLQKPKRQDIVLRAVKGLDLKILFIGDGEEYENLKEFAKQNNIDVTFIKSVKNDELVNYYNLSKLNIQATDYEGFGIPLLEAMACGLDVVCSEIEPFREFAKDVPFYFKTIEQLHKYLKNYQFKGINQYSLNRAKEINGEVMEEKEAKMYKRLLNG